MTWLPISLKNAAKCDKWYQLQNHPITESLNAKGAREKLFTSEPRACRKSQCRTKNKLTHALHRVVWWSKESWFFLRTSFSLTKKRCVWAKWLLARFLSRTRSFIPHGILVCVCLGAAHFNGQQQTTKKIESRHYLLLIQPTKSFRSQT